MVRSSDFSLDEKWAMVEAYVACGGFYTRAIRVTGMPVNRFMVAQWVRELAPGLVRKTIHDGSRIALEVKREAVAALVHRPPEVSPSEIAERYGVARQTVYRWKKETALYDTGMNKNKKKTVSRQDREIRLSSTRVSDSRLDSQVDARVDVRVEKDVYKALSMLNIPLGADGDVNASCRVMCRSLSTSDKTRVVRFLSSTYHVSWLCDFLGLALSTYYYHRRHCLDKTDKYGHVRKLVKRIFHDNYQSYGYRRMTAVLDNEHGIRISEKVVRRIMREENLHVIYHRKKRRYTSYGGENDVCPPNLVQRNFHSSSTNTLWLSDISEFSIPAGKLYLSPILDVYDSRIVAYCISPHPNAGLVNTMLKRACQSLAPGQHPIIHTDRGIHYRWKSWVDICKQYGLTQSMSRKANTGDNAACEGFFGRMKNEMFYHRDWSQATLDDLATAINTYITWYNTKRYTTRLTKGKNTKRSKPYQLNYTTNTTHPSKKTSAPPIANPRSGCGNPTPRHCEAACRRGNP